MVKIQGGQDPFLKFQMAITQKLSISDPSWRRNICLHFYQLFVYNFSNKRSIARSILALPMWAQKCLVSEL